MLWNPTPYPTPYPTLILPSLTPFLQNFINIQFLIFQKDIYWLIWYLIPGSLFSMYEIWDMWDMRYVWDRWACFSVGNFVLHCIIDVDIKLNCVVVQEPPVRKSWCYNVIKESWKFLTVKHWKMWYILLKSIFRLMVEIWYLWHTYLLLEIQVCLHDR